MEGRPRLVRPVPDPLGLYVRPGFNGHVALAARLAEGDHKISGAVIAASHCDTQSDLVSDLRQRNYEAVLDPQTIELATVAGFERPTIQRLPWAGRGVHTPKDLRGIAGIN